MATQAMWVHGSAAVPMYPGGAGPEGTNGHRLQQVRETLPDGPQIPWTDLTGKCGWWGATFRGVQGDTNSFTFSIPTPCFRAGTLVPGAAVTDGRARLVNCFVLYNTHGDSGTFITSLTISDGPNILVDPTNQNNIGIINIAPGVATGDHSGGTSLGNVPNVGAVLIPGVTAFAINVNEAPPNNHVGIFWGLGIEVNVHFGSVGQITFTAAGADFLVQDS